MVNGGRFERWWHVDCDTNSIDYRWNVWGYLLGLNYACNFVQRHDWGEVRYMTKIDYHFIANFMENATLKYIGGLLFWPTLWLYEHTGHRTKRRHLYQSTLQLQQFLLIRLHYWMKLSRLAFVSNTLGRSAASRSFVVVERQFFGAIGGGAAPAPPPL